MKELAGNIDSVEIGSGFAVVEGWLVSTADGSPPADVFIALDGGEPVPIRARRVRDDLRQAGICRGAAAFRIDLPLPGAPAGKVDITLLVPSLRRKVSFFEVAVRSFVPRGALDQADAGGISGWVYDPATWRGGQPARLQFADAVSVAIVPDTVRDDVSEALGLPSRALGFSLSAEQVRTVLAHWPGHSGDGQIPLRLVSNGVVLTEGTLNPGFPAPAAVDLSRAPGAKRGNLDRYKDGYLHGWAVDPGAPEQPIEVAIEMDGIRYATVRADRRRGDLAIKGISRNCGGFSLPISHSPTGRPDVDITMSCALSGERIAKEPLRLHDLPVAAPSQDWARAAFDLGEWARPLLLIMPVYNAPDELAACLDSIVAHSSLPCRLLIIDDASPDPRVAAALGRFAELGGVEILRNEANLGFVATCNRGFSLAAGHDVVLINSDIVVGPRWLENLRLAAYSRPRVGTVTPLSSHAGVFSAPEPNRQNPAPPGWSVADCARLVMATAAGSLPVVPTGNGFCLFIRGECLEAVGGFDAVAFPRGYGEENDFCMRAARAGFVHLMDDRTFVHHERSASFKAEKATIYDSGQSVLRARYPDYKQLTRRFFTGAPVQAVRWRLRRALARQEQRPRPRILFVIATETGGTPLTNADLMTALSDRYEPWLLRSNGHSLTLSRHRPDAAPEVVESHALSEPVEIADHRSQEYARVVAGMLVRSGIELVHIRHLAWHGLDLPALCKALSLPVVLSFHDFYAICPTIKLIDSECRACCLAGRATETPCQPELWDGDGMPPLKSGFLTRWREMMAEALAPVDSFVTTSPEARQRLAAVYPQLARSDFRIIPHGRDFPTMAAPADRRPAHGPVRVLVPGNISPAKGARLIQAVAALDGGRHLEFHVLGQSGMLEAAPGIVLHGGYERDSFQERVSEIDPVLGVVFSCWPETYCHTLTEMWACGLPVMATDLGAVGERIRRHGGGWLHDAEDRPEVVRERLLSIVFDEEDFQARLAEIVAWQHGYGRDYGCDMMAACYDGLYRERIRARRAFAMTGEDRDVLLWAHLGGGSALPPDTLTRRDLLVPFRGIPDTTQPEFAALAGFVWAVASQAQASEWAAPVLAALGGRKLILDLRDCSAQHPPRLPARLLRRASRILHQ